MTAGSIGQTAFLTIRNDRRGCVTRSRDVATISRAEFLNRVRARAEVNQPQANATTGAVVAALQQAGSEGEIDHRRNRLPEDLSSLFA